MPPAVGGCTTCVCLWIEKERDAGMEWMDPFVVFAAAASVDVLLSWIRREGDAFALAVHTRSWGKEVRVGNK